MNRFLTCLSLVVFPAYLSALSTGSFVTISSNPTSGNGTPLLSVGDNGNAFAAWVNFPNNIQTAFFNASTNAPTGAWTFMGTLANGTNPQLAVDQNGNGFIVWVSSGTMGPSTQIMYSQLTYNVATGALTSSTPAQLSTSGTNNFGPLISVSPNGAALVVWLQNAPYQVTGASYNPITGKWSAPTPVFSGVYPSSFQIDNKNGGIAIFNTKGTIQASRITIP